MFAVFVLTILTILIPRHTVVHIKSHKQTLGMQIARHTNFRPTETPTQTPTSSPTYTPTSTHTPSPSPIPSPPTTTTPETNVQVEQHQNETIETTQEAVVETDQIASSHTSQISNEHTGSVLDAINVYRSEHDIHTLSSDSYLCTIAQARAIQLQSIGHLDNHSGFEGYKQDIIARGYTTWGEVTHFTSDPWSPDQVVRSGWADSGSGHRENMLKSTYTVGCGAQSGGYSTAIFGAK